MHSHICLWKGNICDSDYTLICWPGVKCGGSNDIWRNVKSPRHNCVMTLRQWTSILCKWKLFLRELGMRRWRGMIYSRRLELRGSPACEHLSAWWWYLDESCREWRNARVGASLYTARAGLYGQQELVGLDVILRCPWILNKSAITHTASNWHT